MSAYSQEEFNTIFIERASYYLQDGDNKELEPSKVIAFIKENISFIRQIESKATRTESPQVLASINQCMHRMYAALEHYTKQQIKAIANETRHFTADDMLIYLPDQLISMLKNPKCPTKRADDAFIKDIVRYDPQIEFFDNNNQLWDSSSDAEALSLTNKLKACGLELRNISQGTQERNDKLSEIKAIETEVIQHRRAKIQRFLNTDPGIIDILLREQTQAGAAIASGLHIQYCREKLNDTFGADQEHHVISKSDREYKIEFHKQQDNKIIIRVVLHGSMNFFVDDAAFDELYRYEAITEVEYDLQNFSNNRVTKGELILSPYITP